MSTKQPPVYVGEVKLPDAIQTAIIARFFKATELKTFWESYQLACLRSKEVKPPTEQMIRFAKLAKKGMTPSRISKQEKVAPDVVYRAIHKVAVWEYMNS